MHEHCSHENLKYCSHCDITYCLDCSKEWGLNSTYQPYTITTVTDPTWTTSGTVDADTGVNYVPTACSHA